MSRKTPLRRFASATFLTSVAAIVALHDDVSLSYVRQRPLTFALLAVGVLVGELMPVKIPRRGDDEEITVSTPFSFALLLVGGLGPAVLAQGVASVIQDLAVHKPLWRVRFNVGQYTLSMVTAFAVLEATTGLPHIGAARPFSTAELPGVLLAGAAFCVVNATIVGIAVAMYQHVPLRRYLSHDLGFISVTAGLLICLSPIAAIAATYAPALVALFFPPMLAVQRAARVASRSQYNAHHDTLTGLPNRTAFRHAVDEALARDHAPRSCVLLMDLNRFKEVNDTLGHLYGDLLLRAVAERLTASPPRDSTIARLGGDEFVVFVPAEDRDVALALAAEVGGKLRRSFDLDDFVIETDASIGVAMYPDDGDDLDVLLQKADVAMYQAKAGHAGVAFYDEAHDHHSRLRLALTADLRRALETDEIVVWYQPVLDLHRNEVPAVEALVRWAHPELGLLLPNAFLETAERTSLIKPLTDKVLETSLRQLAEWRSRGIDIVVAVNVSTRVLADHHFADTVTAAVGRAGVPADRLRLEVTESALMADPEKAREVLRALDQAGVEISIDDFGTGYSSLAYLTDLPVSEVKIDRSFVTGLETGSREAVIVRSTIDLGHHLGLRVIAEGAEDLPTIEYLRRLGCDVAQGYGISRPLVAEDATRWLGQFWNSDGPARDVVVGLA